MNYESNDTERYACQLQMKDFGREAQDKLKEAHVLVIGAGGLGCPVLQYLTGAGVGHIGIVDNDTVELSNLHRQVLYTTDDIGKGKAATASNRLQKMNPEIRFTTYPFRMTHLEALSVLSKYDLIIDGSDNFATRFMINDASSILKKPLIFGAIGETEGQVGIFHHNTDKPSANLRDLYPSLLPEEAAFTCRERGTLGVVPGMIGILMATEAIKLITQKGIPLSNQLLTCNLFTNQSYRYDIIPSGMPRSDSPQTPEEFLKTDYLRYVSKNNEWKEITGTELDMLLEKENSLLIDVRSEPEFSDIDHASILRIPVDQLLYETEKMEPAEHLIVICSAGNRSKTAATILQKHFKETKKIYSLKGGVQTWKKISRIFS